MKHRVILGLALLVFAGPAFAQKIFIDYDHEYDFDKIATFAWADTAETSVKNEDPLLHSRIVNAIEHYLVEGGLTEASEDPDVYVTYHASSKEEMSLNTSSLGYGYPGGWGWGDYGYGYGYGGWGGGMGTTTTTVTKYEVGALVIDVWDASTKEAIWRGTAMDIMISDNPEKMAKRIDKTLHKIVKQSRNLSK
jgi:hypothetical protein